MRARRWLIAAILATCVIAPVAEAFDRWDRPLPPGDDTEAGVLFVALSVGLALSVAAVVVKSLQSIARQPLATSSFQRPRIAAASLTLPRTAKRLPPPLRI